jgi:hypothetical protein
MRVITIQSLFGTGFSQAYPTGVSANQVSVMIDTSSSEYDPVTVARILDARQGKFETVPNDQTLLDWLTK